MVHATLCSLKHGLFCFIPDYKIQSYVQFVVLYRGLGILPCMGWETPCSMRAMPRLPCPRSRLPCTCRSHLPCPSFYLPEYTSHSDWLHHNNLIYIVILNYILSSEQQNRPSQQGNAPTHGGMSDSMFHARHVPSARTRCPMS